MQLDLFPPEPIALTDRQKEVLAVIRANPGISINKLYIMCSPACQRTGRTKSWGTHGWTIPKTLERKGAIVIACERARRTHRYGSTRYKLFAIDRG